MIGCLTLAHHRAECCGLASADGRRICWSAFYAILGTYVIPQMIYRKSSGQGLLPLVPLFRVDGVVDAAADVGARIPAIAYSIWAINRRPTKPPRPRSTSTR